MNFGIITILVQAFINSVPSVEYNESFDLHQYVDEVGTLRLHGPRQSGHTTAIMKLCTSSDLIVFESSKHRNMCLFDMKQSVQTMDRHQLKNSVLMFTPKVIFVDNYSFFNPEEKQKIKSLITEPTQKLVLLQ